MILISSTASFFNIRVRYPLEDEEDEIDDIKENEDA